MLLFDHLVIKWVRVEWRGHLRSVWNHQRICWDDFFGCLPRTYARQRSKVTGGDSDRSLSSERCFDSARCLDSAVSRDHSRNVGINVRTLRLCWHIMFSVLRWVLIVFDLPRIFVAIVASHWSTGPSMSAGGTRVSVRAVAHCFGFFTVRGVPTSALDCLARDKRTRLLSCISTFVAFTSRPFLPIS